MINEYIENFCVTPNTDYGDGKSVKQHNKSMNLCRKIALNIIMDKTKENSVDGFGNRIWMENYLKMNPKDKALINR